MHDSMPYFVQAEQMKHRPQGIFPQPGYGTRRSAKYAKKLYGKGPRPTVIQYMRELVRATRSDLLS